RVLPKRSRRIAASASREAVCRSSSRGLFTRLADLSSSAGRSTRPGVAHGEPVALVGPTADAAETGLAKHALEIPQPVLVAVLGMDAFAGLEAARSAGPAHLHGKQGFQVHFHPRKFRVEEG